MPPPWTWPKESGPQKYHPNPSSAFSESADAKYEELLQASKNPARKGGALMIQTSCLGGEGEDSNYTENAN